MKNSKLHSLRSLRLSPSKKSSQQQTIRSPSARSVSSNSLLKNKIFSYLKILKKGETTTYKILAEKFNSHPRGIARILASNTDKSVPCFKVIRSDGKAGGYNGLLGKSKEELLKKDKRHFKHSNL